ncbi:MAG: glucose 1-dehydrogenase [Syntrophorhabdales bacterium]|jgi:NAD(P)-dependent dehydrogenase (short-subunit alcohol dehydrogenase family)
MNTSNLFSLSGKVGIVTGAGRGIGRVLALALADAGCHVVIADVLVREGEEAAGEIRKKGKDSIFIKVDLPRKAEIEAMASETVKRFGKIDILVNNAGINIFSPAEDFSLDDWNKVVNVNLTGTFFCAQAVGKIMIGQNKGKIVNVASIGGMTGTYRKAVAYDSTKAGIINFTRSLAVEWGRYNINVNAIAPGMIETDLTRGRLEDKEFHDYFIKRVPLGKIGQAYDLAGPVIFLCSEASDWLTGQTMVLDGGQTLLDLTI